MINSEKVFTFTQMAADEFQFTVASDLPYFEGHFPANPVLPAVALLDLSLEVIKRVDSSLKGMFLTIKSAKFSEVIRPLDTLTIKVRRDQTTAQWTLEYTNQAEVSVSKLSFSAT